MAALDNAAKQKAQLLAEKAELRILLLKQFNAVLQTRDTARGLIVNMSDVLFDTGKSSLRPGAREKLAKVAGIVSGHPGLSWTWKATPIASAATTTINTFPNSAAIRSATTWRSREWPALRSRPRASAKPSRWQPMTPRRAGSRIGVWNS